MKLRTSFVSNSSSCSFIIEDVAAGLQALKELDILDATEFNDIEVRFSVSQETFNLYKMDKYESWRDEQYNEVYCRCQPCELIQMPAGMKQSIKELSFSCEDYDQPAVFILSLLYETLKVMDVAVNSENSEMDFPTAEDSNSVAAKLFKYIMNNKKQEKQDN